LPLCNSFDMLTSKEVVQGEALLPYLNSKVPMVGQLTATQLEDLVIPIEIACSLGITSSEAPLPKGTRPSDTVLPLDKHGLDGVGRLSLPKPPSLSIKQGSIAVIVVDLGRLKAWVDTPVLTLRPQPITTNYDYLTIDKLPPSQTLVPASNCSFHSDAALKSVHILSKFWGDEVDEVEEVIEDATSHDKRLEMEDYPSLSESTNTERKKKKHVNIVMPSSFNSVEMRTRAQKGTSKAALADT